MEKKITLSSARFFDCNDCVVELLRPYIKTFFRKGDYFYKRCSAYGLKHYFENYFKISGRHIYVAMDDLVRAMILEGFAAVETEQNCIYFNILKTDCDVLRLITGNSVTGGRPVEIRNRIKEIFPEIYSKYEIDHHGGIFRLHLSN